MTREIPETEFELLANIAGRDQHAFKCLYDRYHSKIYTFCVRQLKSTELAEEVLQETFLKIWLMQESLTQVKNIESYMRTIARNRCFDYIRKLEKVVVISNNYEGLEADIQHNDTEEAILLADTRKVLENGIDLLPQQQKNVYNLCKIQGLTYEQAAEKLNLSPLTVKNHMQAALNFLRKYVSEHTDLAIALIILGII